MNHFLKLKSLIYSSVLKPLTVQATLSHFFTMAEGTKKGDLSEPKEGKVTEKKFESSSRMYSQQKMTRGATAVQEKERYLKMDLEEKRQCYKCKDKYFLLDDVPSWSSYFKEHKSKLLKHWHGKKRPEPGYSVNEELNQKISIWRGDITRLEIDAIVNAANGSLLGGGGVDGAIHAAAGSMLKVECATLNGCDTGDAKISGGYKLPAKYVIHTVGPIGACDEMLIGCYEKSLSLVQEGGLKSVAFPCISTGIYGFPNERAAPLVLQTAREFLEKHGENVDRIIFCLFMPVDVKLYEMHMQQFFPTSTDEKLEGKESTKDVKKDSSVKDGQRNEESSPKAKKSNNMESPSGKISKKEEETIIEKDTVEDIEKGKENDLAKDQHSVKKEEILEVKTESQNNETADKNGLENKNVEKSDIKLDASGEVMDDTTSQNIAKPDKDTTEVHQIPQTNDNDLAEVHKTRQTTNKIAAEVQKSDETKAEDVAEAIKSPQTMDTTDNATVEGAEKGKITPKL